MILLPLVLLLFWRVVMASTPIVLIFILMVMMRENNEIEVELQHNKAGK